LDRISRRRFFTIAGGTGLAGVVAGGGLDLRGDLGTARRSERNGGAAFTGKNPLGTKRVIWSVDTASPVVALTFDDGPHPELTPRILRILDKRGIRATFNVMGLCAVHHHDVARRIVAEGHELGNHTWTHLDLSQQTAPETLRQLRRAKEVIEDIAGARARLFRPPRGELSGVAVRYAAKLDYDVLLWSVARGPAGIGTPAAVLSHLSGAIRPGSIVGLHDGLGRSTFSPRTHSAKQLRARRDVEIEALPEFLDRAMADGYSFVTASRLVDEDVSPAAGRTRPR
jgi:peptidoglycan/xylan/chitin deacetylase (PgdA/CDA1 family)